MGFSLMNLAIVFLVTIIGWIVADGLFKRRPGSQDFVWRLTLSTTLALPVFLGVAMHSAPHGLLHLPWLKPRSMPVALNADPNSTATDSSTSFDASNSQVVPEYSRGQPPLASTESLSQDRSATNGLVFAANELPASSLNEPADSVAITAVAVPVSIVGNPWQTMAMKVAAVVWLGGTMLLLTRLLAGWIGLNWLRRSAQPGELLHWRTMIDRATTDCGLQRELVVRKSANVSTPMVVGITSPMILIPIELAETDSADSTVRAILTHEAMHIARSDPFWNMLLCISVALWWPVPLIHVMSKRMNGLRERLSDAGVATKMNATDLAEALFRLGASHRQRINLLGLQMRSTNQLLESRIDWLLNHSHAKTTSPGRPVRIAVCGGLIVIALTTAMVRLVPASSSEKISPIRLASHTQDDDYDHDGELRGVVRNNSGTPIVGASVYLLPVPNGAYSLPTHPISTITDTDGGYHFDQLKSGTYRLWAENDSLTSLQHRMRGKRLEIDDTPESPTTEDLELHRGCEYDVEVRSSDGQPIEGARIDFGWTDIERAYFTGADGVARIKGLSSADWYFIIRADGFATQFLKTSKQDLGTREELAFELERGCGIRVQLTDQDNQPVPDVKIYVSDEEIRMSPRYGVLITDENGQLEMDGLPSGRKLRISTTIDGYETPQYLTTLTEIGKFETIELRCRKLPYGGDIAFTVVDESGAPISEARITNTGRSSTFVRQVTTDERGQALMENLYASGGSVKVRVDAPNMISQTIKVNPGSREKPSTQTIELIRGGTVRGVIVDPDGNRVPNVTVFINDGHRGFNEMGGSTVADHQGRFQFSGIPLDSTLTVYTPKGYAPVNRYPVKAPSGEVTIVEIQLQPESVIRVRAFDAITGEPIPRFNIRIGHCMERREGDVASNGLLSSLINPGVNVHGSQKEYVFDHQPSGFPIKLIVSAEGYETREIPRAVTVLRRDSVVLGVELQPSKD